jgi:hypothetical protein
MIPLQEVQCFLHSRLWCNFAKVDVPHTLKCWQIGNIPIISNSILTDNLGSKFSCLKKLTVVLEEKQGFFHSFEGDFLHKSDVPLPGKHWDIDSIPL